MGTPNEMRPIAITRSSIESHLELPSVLWVLSPTNSTMADFRDLTPDNPLADYQIQALIDTITLLPPNVALLAPMLFTSEQEFYQACERELIDAHNKQRTFAASGKGYMTFSISLINRVIPLDDMSACLGAEVTKSTNPSIHVGDMILACDDQPLFPGRDIGIITREHTDAERAYVMSVVRGEDLLRVQASAKFTAMSPDAILHRRCFDAVETAILRKIIERLKVSLRDQ